MKSTYIPDAILTRGELQEVSLEQLLSYVEKHDCNAYFELACRYNEGNGLEKDDSKAFYYCLLAAQNGNPYAQCQLATLLFDSDEHEALQWVHKSQDQGHYDASYLIYKHDKRIDKAHAFQYLVLAARYGCPNAQFDLGVELCRLKQITSGLEYIQQAALQGHKPAKRVIKYLMNTAVCPLETEYWHLCLGFIKTLEEEPAECDELALDPELECMHYYLTGKYYYKDGQAYAIVQPDLDQACLLLNRYIGFDRKIYLPHIAIDAQLSSLLAIIIERKPWVIAMDLRTNHIDEDAQHIILQMVKRNLTLVFVRLPKTCKTHYVYKIQSYIRRNQLLVKAETLAEKANIIRNGERRIDKDRKPTKTAVPSLLGFCTFFIREKLKDQVDYVVSEEEVIAKTPYERKAISLSLYRILQNKEAENIEYKSQLTKRF